jgi:hypothetical protein
MLSSAGDDRRSTLSWLWWFISWNKGEEPPRLLSTPDVNKQSRAAVTEIESSRTVSKFLKMQNASFKEYFEKSRGKFDVSAYKNTQNVDNI